MVVVFALLFASLHVGVPSVPFASSPSVSAATSVAQNPVDALPAPSPCPRSAAHVELAPKVSPSTEVSPAPCPSVRPLPREIGRVNAPGRGTVLIGKTLTASQGTIGQAEIANRPIARPGEVLEAIPGVIITQHSGEGKANQYYLRGFQLDHGTDLSATIVGEPINFPTHAHGQGYSDINWLLPEVVSSVEFKKGPYFADEGDFSTAGSYNLFYRNTIPDTIELGTGANGYDRLFLAGSPRVGTGNLLYALEAYHNDGTFDRPDNYRRFNGVMRYGRSSEADDFNVTLLGYDGHFLSSDQIPQHLITEGVLDRYGLIDPSDGGNTYRYALSTQYEHHVGNATTRVSAYVIRYSLDLFSNFTYGLDDATDYYNITANPVTCRTTYSTCRPGANHVGSYEPSCAANGAPSGAGGAPQPFRFACGDQREQEDQRVVTGFKLARSWRTPVAENTLGLGLRNDNIANVALYLDTARSRNDTLTDDHVSEREINAYAQTEQHIGPKFRATAGLRGEFYTFNVHAFDPRNSGFRPAGLLLPKLSFAYRSSSASEVYLSAGESFHSNDGRGLVQTVDPLTRTTIDPSGAAVEHTSPLVRADGEELGYRLSTSKLHTTVSLWRLGIASELTFSGDAGVTEAGRPTERKGIEITNFYAASRALTLDADFSTSTARFRTDPDHIGTGVPESLAAVASLGITADHPRYAASLRLRYFGPRNLIEDGSQTTRPTTLLNSQIRAKFARNTSLTLDVFNILGANADDTAYFYNSWTREDNATPALAANPAINPALGGAGIPDFHFHPTPKRTFRLSLSAPI